MPKKADKRKQKLRENYLYRWYGVSGVESSYNAAETSTGTVGVQVIEQSAPPCIGVQTIEQSAPPCKGVKTIEQSAPTSTDVVIEHQQALPVRGVKRKRSATKVHSFHSNISDATTTLQNTIHDNVRRSKRQKTKSILLQEYVLQFSSSNDDATQQKNESHACVKNVDAISSQLTSSDSKCEKIRRRRNTILNKEKKVKHEWKLYRELKKTEINQQRNKAYQSHRSSKLRQMREYNSMLRTNIRTRINKMYTSNPSPKKLKARLQYSSNSSPKKLKARLQYSSDPSPKKLKERLRYRKRKSLDTRKTLFPLSSSH